MSRSRDQGLGGSAGGCQAEFCLRGKDCEEGAGESPLSRSFATAQTRAQARPTVRRDRECDQLTREEADRK